MCKLYDENDHFRQRKTIGEKNLHKRPISYILLSPI